MMEHMWEIWAATLGTLLGCAFELTRDAEFNKLADRYFEECVFKFDPVLGTRAGFRQYDGLLALQTKAEIDEHVSVLKQFEADIEEFGVRGLSAEIAADRELVLSSIRGHLLTAEVVRQWEKNPDAYSFGITAAIFTVMNRSFPPAAVRLQNVIAREKLIPRVLESARANLKNPPRIFTEVALLQLPVIVNFFRKDVPAAFRNVADTALLAEFNASNQGVIEALEAYQLFLEVDLLPRSAGDFRIGADAYRKKLEYDEMVDTPLDLLLEIGWQDLRRNQQEFTRVAKQINPSHTARETLAEASQDHPSADKLLQSFKDVLGRLREFIEKHKIITIPPSMPPIVEETPPFMRALISAFMDIPGPFEKDAKEAFFSITLPEKTWGAKQTEEYLASFNNGIIVSTAAHEVYPGHYLQYLWMARAPTKVRKLLGCTSNAEGWAHYVEQMLLDEGYGNGDLKLRLGQLQDALLRNVRFIVGIQMHTGTMTMEQATELFVTEGYQARSVAEREAIRGTGDPMYLVYTLGKLEILKLREDYKQAKGGTLNLQSFHDAFMQQGFPPIKIIRQALLGDDSAVL
jgi:uncharacterized protein (DUF885 family)